MPLIITRYQKGYDLDQRHGRQLGRVRPEPAWHTWTTSLPRLGATLQHSTAQSTVQHSTAQSTVHACKYSVCDHVQYSYRREIEI